MRFNPTSSQPGNKPRGFTVVELMIAMAIATILMLGVIQTFVMSKHTYKLDDALARAQENARYAVNYLSREIRMAGYAGCRGANTVNVLNYVPGDWKTDFSDAIQGWEGDAGNTTFPVEFKTKSIPYTDAFVVHRASDTQYKIVFDHYPSVHIQLNTTQGLSQGDIVVATDCSQTSIFQITNAIGASLTVDHSAAAGGVVPGNCTQGLGSPLNCGSQIGNGHNFGKNSGSIFAMTSTAYYIGHSNTSNGNALFSLAMSQGGVGNPEELVDGIEDMQVLYGVDTSVPSDGLANEYIPANQVAGTPNGWKGVVSVRLGLLVDTVNDNVTKSTDNTTYTIADTQVKASTTAAHQHPVDHKLRFPITTTIKIRNR